ncbi:uncharacterized protein CIMG_09262 [Coccidioides immitis RS]|uniref:Ribosome biogenesis protein Alb1 n=4 Tax=Coccidioides immitis TaxID=5501 RepID=J3K1Y9_COCIM|nr:uncharacterized protein CIMG_09262 [Coccidioides immitis RS]KMP08871.1 hypothetical protein CIRG_08552 [Coccidioides immitis RMSCC 2394]KMU81992.1 hypothetical protein CISG_09478 [Coccidioides immitis RMSCC 3703]KMU89109.1 hypothetical protein CIHG_07041 [Coccidioides immitis H538.4]TPX20722.1 hypothetical protein DIZ76_016617 [Coccidioides immitis]EAS28058.3 hypothetical protein CIMG_09262 [Coccidioides immitis RS]
MKTPKLKSNRTKSVRSRAARRDASPSVDVDKSIASLPRAERTVLTRPSVLGAQHVAGVSKKKQKRQTRAQRLRQEKGLERAEIVMDKTEKKVAKSMNRGKVVKARKATWDDLNKRGTNAYKILQDQGPDAMDTSDNERQPKQRKPAVSSVNPPQLAQPAQTEQFDFELDGEIT